MAKIWVISLESGEKYAQIKLCLQVKQYKAILNKYVGGFDEREQKRMNLEKVSLLLLLLTLLLWEYYGLPVFMDLFNKNRQFFTS